MTRVLFAGTPEIAVPALTLLLERGGPELEVVGVLANPDRPAGRKRVVTPGPVASLAAAKGLPLLQPERLNGDARDAVRRLQPGLLAVVAYGRIFGPKFLDLFPHGAINMHPSLLPRHRGPSPIQAAILAGDVVTGVTVQRISLEMDAGPVIEQREYKLSGRETAPVLHERLGTIGADLMVAATRAVARGEHNEAPQDDSEATYCALINKADGYVTLAETAVELDRMVRAYTPWPGVWATWRDRRIQLVETVPAPGEGSRAEPGQFVGVDNALGILLQTSNGILAVRRLKPETRTEMNWKAFVNGNRDVVGSRLERIV